MPETNRARLKTEVRDIYKNFDQLSPEEQEVVIAEIHLIAAKINARVKGVQNPITQLEHLEPDKEELVYYPEDVLRQHLLVYIDEPKDRALQAAKGTRHTKLYGELALLEKQAVEGWTHWGPKRVGRLEAALKEKGLRFGMPISPGLRQEILEKRLKYVQKAEELRHVCERFGFTEVLQAATGDEKIEIPSRMAFRELCGVHKDPKGVFERIGNWQELLLPERVPALIRGGELLMGDIVLSPHWGEIAQKIPNKSYTVDHNTRRVGPDYYVHLAREGVASEKKRKELLKLYLQWIALVKEYAY